MHFWQPAVLNNGRTRGFNKLINGYAIGCPTVGRAEHPAVAPIGGMRSAFFVYQKDDLSIVVLAYFQGQAQSSLSMCQYKRQLCRDVSGVRK